MFTASLFDADLKEGAQIISTFPPLCSAADIRKLPGLEAASDLEIEHRLGTIFPMISGVLAGRRWWWREDVRDYWRNLHDGCAFNSSLSKLRRRKFPPCPPITWWRDFCGDELYRAMYAEYRRRASEHAALQAQDTA